MLWKRLSIDYGKDKINNRMYTEISTPRHTTETLASVTKIVYLVPQYGLFVFIKSINNFKTH